jgi:hypothetical protein
MGESTAGRSGLTLSLVPDCGGHRFPLRLQATALPFLKGQVMKLSKGKANPAVAGEILEKKLKG